MDIKGRIVLKQATFTHLPDFTQTHYVVSPDLDNTVLPKQPTRLVPAFIAMLHSAISVILTYLSLPYSPLLFLTNVIQLAILWLLAINFYHDTKLKDEETQWRALKRMAEAGKHHILARQCFKGETLARRWHHDTPLTGAFWAGLAFEALSDFGQSFMRPLLWLGVVIGLSTFGLLKLSQDTTTQPPTTCNKVVAASLLSVNKSLFLSADPSGSVNRHLLCLYGQQNETIPTSPPNTPDEATVLMMAQVLFSVVLLFLFGHAIKARFTIS